MEDCDFVSIAHRLVWNMLVECYSTVVVGLEDRRRHPAQLRLIGLQLPVICLSHCECTKILFLRSLARSNDWAPSNVFHLFVSYAIGIHFLQVSHIAKRWRLCLRVAGRNHN